MIKIYISNYAYLLLCRAGWPLIGDPKLSSLLRGQIAGQQSTNCADSVIEIDKPEPCSAISASSEKIFAIRREGYIAYFIRMSCKAADFFASCHIPQTGRPIFATSY